jgi:hypothetical protein
MARELDLGWWEGVYSVKVGHYGMNCLIYEKIYN